MENTALLVVDLMERIVALETAPYTDEAVVERTHSLAVSVRRRGGLVVLVRSERADGAPEPPGGALVAQLKPQPSDVVVTKRAWNAFHETELDSTLQRRGIRTLILAGIATNFGVEGTARAANERDYELIFAEQAITGLHTHAHAFAIDYIFPRLGRVSSVEQILVHLNPELSRAC